MKKLVAAVVAAVPLLTVIPAPAQAAHHSPSVEILTEKAVAQGSAYTDPFTHKRVIFRPTFTLTTKVVCPAGARGYVNVPVWAMTAPGVTFTCTGARQVVKIPFTATYHNNAGRYRDPITATLGMLEGNDVDGYTLVTLDSDTERVVVTLIAKSRY